MTIARPTVRTAVALVFTAACGTANTSESRTMTVRDSAGIAIIHHPSAAIDAVPAWTLGPATMSLGGPEADAVHDMTGVEQALLEDSTFVVADASAMQLRRFSFAGTLLRTGAGPGAGPGELLSVGRLHPTPTGLAVLDFSRGLLIHYTPALQFREQISLQELPGGARYGVLGLEASGALVTLGGAGAGPPDGTPDGAIQRQRWVVERFGSASRRADTLFTLLGAEFHAIGTGVRGLRFGVSSFVEMSPSGFITGDGARWEIALRDTSGTIQRLVRFDLPRRAVTEPMRAEQLRLDHKEIDELPAGGFKGIRRMAELDFADPKFPDSLPAFDRLTLSRDGTLWIREGMAVTDTVQRWLVVRGDSLVGRLAMPSALTLLDVRRDRALVRRTDSLDVGYVELHAIVPRS